MAQTFIGNLILRLQENVSAGAQKAAGALKGVDRAAAGLGRNAGSAARLGKALDGLAASAAKASAPWGANLQAQLQRLGASASELDKVRSSWDQLQARLSAGGIGGKMRTNEIAAWRMAVAGNLTAVRVEADRTRQSLSSLSDQIRRMATTGGMVAGGVGSALIARAGIKASASYEELKIALNQKNWGPETEKAILDEANRMAVRWKQSRATALETLIDAGVSSDPPIEAVKKSDTYGRALVMESLHSGPERAAEGVRNLDKARENLGYESPEAVKEFFDGYYRAKSILGKDLNTEQYRQAIQYARTAGKVVTPEYLATTLPSIIAESKGADAGTKLRAIFDQFVVGRASKEAQAKQKEYGLRDEKGVLQGEEFFKNPGAWVNDVVAKKLEERGVLKRDSEGRVDKDSKVALAREIGQLTNNRLSSDNVYQLIDQASQYERQKRQMKNSKGGLEGADQVLAQSPTANWQALQNSLGNVASSVGEGVMPGIVSGLNGLSGGINNLATSLQAMDSGTVAKLGATGLGLYGIMKLLGPAILAKKAIDLATPAAVGAGASAVAGTGAGATGAAVGGGLSTIAKLARWARVGGPLGVAGGMYDLLSGGYQPVVGDRDQVKPGEAHNEAQKRRKTYNQRFKADQDQQFKSMLPWIEGSAAPAADADKVAQAEAWRKRASGGADVLDRVQGNVAPQVDTSSLDAAGMKADETQAKLSGLNQTVTPGVDISALDAARTAADETQAKMQGLNATVRPGVDVSALREANALLDAALAKLKQLGTEASAVGARVGSAVTRELRAAHSDFGVSP